MRYICIDADTWENEDGDEVTPQEIQELLENATPGTRIIVKAPASEIEDIFDDEEDEDDEIEDLVDLLGDDEDDDDF